MRRTYKLSMLTRQPGVLFRDLAGLGKALRYVHFGFQHLRYLVPNNDRECFELLEKLLQSDAGHGLTFTLHACVNKVLLMHVRNKGDTNCHVGQKMCWLGTNNMPGLVESIGASVWQRKVLFWGICVPLRLGIAYAAWRARGRQWFVFLAVTLSVIAVLINATKASDTSVWWSRRAHGAHALAVLVLAAVLRMPGYVPHVLLSDVLFGLLSSFTRQAFLA